jgi:hypothetical protein
MITQVTFQEVALHGQKSVKCAGGCKRTLKRQRKFWQTLSPFNKNALGEVKTRSEIQDQLITERNLWLMEPETCFHCAGKVR